MAIKGLLVGLTLPAVLVLGKIPGAPPAAGAPQPHSTPRQAAFAARLVVAPSGNEARYRIRERLVGVELPYDAVGVTEPGAITGSITLEGDGRVVPAASRLVIRIGGLTSDQERRDGFVRRRLLETDRFPTVELVPTEVRGLGATVPKPEGEPWRSWAT